MKRLEIFARDGHRCVYCGEVRAVEELTVDHVQPRMRGGDSSGGNVVTACAACNARKGGRRLAEFLAAEPTSWANFRQLAVHVWARHLRAVEEELRRLTGRGLPRRDDGATSP